MTTSNKATLSRKIALGLGAIVVSTMTLAGAANAGTKIQVHLGFGGGYGHGFHGGWYGGGYGPNCWTYWKLYKITGKWKFKKMFYHCKAMYW